MATDSFFGKYRLIERMGFGGMAEVFRAVLTGAEGFYRELAIKRIRPELTGNPDFERMFIDEARIAAKLQHANIVQIFDFDRIGNFTYIVMEYVRGQDLASVLSRGKHRNRPLPIDVACHIALEFLAGLRYAHEKTEGSVPLNIVHRDISPGNVLISYEGEVKVTDFGIAKAITSTTHTRTGEMKGKYSYMSPEQVRQQALDQRSDLFSVGTVFYEMLTCERAFRDESDFRTLERVVQGDLQPMRSIRPEIPPSLERLVAQATSVNPDERFQSAADMIQELETCCRQSGLHTSAEALRRYLRDLFPDEIAKEPEIFFGKYRLFQRLRTGRMTEVYRAVFTGLESFHQELAIKRIRAEFAQDDSLEHGFLDAALAVPRMQHANIVQVYDVDRVGNHSYVAMEYVDGRPLEAVLEQAEGQGTAVPVAVSLHVALEVLSGLRYAHEKKDAAPGPGVVHGDVCANNVLVSHDGEVKLVDFGLGDVFFPSASPDEILRDYAHRSPEQINQRGVDQRSDLFSAGALLYRMLTGARSYRDLEPSTLRGRIEQDGHLKQELDPEVLSGLADLVARGMAADPGERPATAAQMRLELFDLCRRANLDPSANSLRSFLGRLFPELPAPEAPPATGSDSEATPDLREESTPAQGPARLAPPGSTQATKADLPVSMPGKAPKAVPAPFFPLEPSGPKGAEPGLDEALATPVKRPVPGRGVPASRRARSVPAWGKPVLFALAIVVLTLAVLLLLRQLGDETSGKPDAGPAAGGPPRLTVLMRSLPALESWYRTNVFAPFEKEHGIQIRTVRYNTIDEIPELLASDRVQLDLVKVHLALSRVLVEQDLILPVETLLTGAGRAGAVRELESVLDPLAVDLSRIRTAIENPICYLPRKLETNFIAYRTSKVEDALRHWPGLRPRLESELRRLTGHGLPRGYEFESDPDRWDTYDNLVLHYYWANRRQDDGQTLPRVARRTYHYWGTLLEFMDDLAGTGIEGRLGLDASPEAVDVFEWLALYRELGLYHPQVWSGEMNVTGSVIYDLLRRGQIYWAKVHSLAALELLGSKESGFAVSLPDPGDLAFTRMARRVSVELDGKGSPRRIGTRRTVVTGWFWGIPRRARDPLLAYELASFLVSREIHQKDVSTFVIQPIRSDVRFESSELGERLGPLLKAQMAENGDRIVPRAKSTDELRRTMDRAAKAWEEIVLKRGYLDDARISREKIRTLLEGIYGG